MTQHESTVCTSHPEPRRSVQVDAELLHRIEANMAWLLGIASPHCGSEPESYDLADATAAHSDLAAILLVITSDLRSQQGWLC